MQNFLRPSRALTFLCVLALSSLPACGGGGGGNNSSSGGATGGSSNPFAPTDLTGDWTGHLTPRENSDLPWANGDTRIMSRNFFVRADGQGNFYFCQPGTEYAYDVVSGGASVDQSEIGRKGRFTVAFKELAQNREQLILVGRLNDARNLIFGEYELRSRTVNTTGQEVEAVDAGSFELTLSSGPGNFQPSILEGSWSGRNYHHAPLYSNMSVEIGPNGSVIGGGIETELQTWQWDTTGVNDLAFGLFTDSSVGMFEDVNLIVDNGGVMRVHNALVDSTGTYLTGSIEDTQGNITYFRMLRE